MIYYEDSILRIRDLCASDAAVFCREERAQGWIHAKEEKYRARFADAQTGKAVALVAEYAGQPAGYINIYPNSHRGSLANQNLPEIVDFGVLKKFRCRGIGAKLMDTAEEIAARFADTVYLGVGLDSSYGNAQRMYSKRGYIPDGNGVWYENAPAAPDQRYLLDDLALYLLKKLR